MGGGGGIVKQETASHTEESMKITKKLLIAALLVMGITLMACNNGNGGSPETGTGGGSGGGTGSGTTTLPASKGTDPFEGLEFLIHQQGGDAPHYEVDTEKKTIVVQRLIGDKRTDLVEYNYSYDSTTTPTPITLKMTKIAPYYETLTPIEELREMEGAEYFLPVYSQLRTYTVDIISKTGQQATVTFEGQYNNNSPWYEQRAGYFYNGSYYVRTCGNMIEYKGDSFPIIKVTDSIIKCISMKDNLSKEFPYTITGSGKQTQVTITVEDNTEVTCSWSASPSLDPSL